MKFLALPSVLVLALAPSWSHSESSNSSLLGCWRAVNIVQHYQNGTKAEDASGRCTFHFKLGQLESSCASATGTVTSTYRYRVERPGFYLATMTGSTFRTSLIGSTREYRYSIDGDRLKTAIDFQHPEPVAPTMTVRVETEAARMACQ
jgi:hypothetical protein